MHVRPHALAAPQLWRPLALQAGLTDTLTQPPAGACARALATLKTAWPLSATVLFWFSFASSSASARAGSATALSYPVEPPRPCAAARATVSVAQTGPQRGRAPACPPSTLSSRRSRAARGGARLGVQEGRAAVRRHHKVAAKALQAALGAQLLDGEQERHALAAGHLDGDRRVVDAVLLLELHVAVAVHVELAGDLRGGARWAAAARGAGCGGARRAGRARTSSSV